MASPEWESWSSDKEFEWVFKCSTGKETDTVTNWKKLHPKFSFYQNQYYAKAAEAESWMSDKKPLVASAEYGKDEDSTVALIRKHENVLHELSAFKPRITDLQSESQSMLSEGHYDSEAIRKKQVRARTQPVRKSNTKQLPALLLSELLGVPALSTGGAGFTSSFTAQWN